jgi:hypothetical protein
MSVSVWERERTWIIEKNCVAKSHITVKIITELNRSKSAQIGFPGKTPCLPTVLPETIAPDRANRRLRLF